MSLPMFWSGSTFFQLFPSKICFRYSFPLISKEEFKYWLLKWKMPRFLLQIWVSYTLVVTNVITSFLWPTRYLAIKTRFLVLSLHKSCLFFLLGWEGGTFYQMLWGSSITTQLPHKLCVKNLTLLFKAYNFYFCLISDRRLRRRKMPDQIWRGKLISILLLWPIIVP